MINAKKINRYKSIAIIGNGFDQAHGYRTSYNHFVESVGKDFFDEYRNYLRTYCNSDIEWSAFENRLDELMQAFYQHEFADNVHSEKVKSDLVAFNKWFQELHNSLMQYLTCETQQKTEFKLKSIKKVLKKHTIAINFNYTSVAVRYNSPTIHVHGSLSENYIVLGIDPINACCLMTYEQQKWQKRICREKLSFHRYIKSKIVDKEINPNDYDEICTGFDRIEGLKNSGKGFENGDILGWRFEKIYREFLNDPKQKDRDLSHISFHKIKKLYVLGHGIVADKTYLTDLLKKCTRLKKVIIFSYKDEPIDQWEEKAAFFKPYCKSVVKRMYE